MCLAIPVKIESVHEGELATVLLNGVRTEISIALVEDVKPGEYVIVHVGYALSKLDTDEAEKTLELFQANSTADRT